MRKKYGKILLLFAFLLSFFGCEYDTHKQNLSSLEIFHTAYEMRELTLSNQEKNKLGILIKGVFKCNLIYNEGGSGELLVPYSLEMLPTDRNKISFVIYIMMFEEIIGYMRGNNLTCNISSEQADELLFFAVGEKFENHNGLDHIIDYSNGVYSYTLTEVDEAMWDPYIDIENITMISNTEIRLEGLITIIQSINSEEYTYEYEAYAQINPESPFGGYTLRELYCKER